MLRSIDEVAKQRRRQDADDGIFDDSSVGSADDGSSEEDEVLFDKGQSVEVLDSASSRWERATVEKVHSDGTYKVSIDANDRRLTHMPAQSLRAAELSMCCNWRLARSQHQEPLLLRRRPCS